VDQPVIHAFAQTGAELDMIRTEFKLSTMSTASKRIRFIRWFTASLLATAPHAAAERISVPAEDDTVIIKAREAWEDETPDTVHFRGNFQLETRDWSVVADEATLHGKLDDPDSVILTGLPAMITIRASRSGQSRDVSGEAPRIIYTREQNSIRMEGGATLTTDESILSGDQIEYRIDEDRINARGDSGVRIRIDTKSAP
jgi:lipopolysaccharide transport protein LptA